MPYRVTGLGDQEALDALSYYMNLSEQNKRRIFTRPQDVHRYLKDVMGPPRRDSTFRCGDVTVRYNDHAVFVESPGSLERVELHSSLNEIKEYLTELFIRLNILKPENPQEQPEAPQKQPENPPNVPKPKETKPPPKKPSKPPSPKKPKYHRPVHMRKRRGPK